METAATQYTAKGTDDHSKVVQWFEEAEDATVDARKASERDADYYDGKQLTAEEIKILKRRKQPPVVNNRIKPKIDFMLGAELKTRVTPKAYPRNPQVDEDAANACTDALRYVADDTKLERVRSLCYEDGLKYGTYGAQIVVEPKGKDYCIDVVHVPWDRIFYDPHSRAKDFSDAKYKGIVIWEDKEDALVNPLYKAKDVESILATLESVTPADTYDDVPKNRWYDKTRNRVRVVYMEYLREGKWYYCYFTGADFLTKPTLMPYVDDDGLTISSLEFQSLFVDRDGNRYGQVRQYIDMQDEINKRRSKGIHLINSRQTIGESGAVEDVNKAKSELAKPDGHIEVVPGMRFEMLTTNDMSAGNFNMLQEAKNEIDAQGPNAALVGAEDRNLSGRAIQALQGGSNTETSIQIDGLRDWEHRIYRLIWFCIKKYWTAEKWVRVTDDENTPRYVGLNVPMTVGELKIAEFRKNGEEIDDAIEQQIMALPGASDLTPQKKNNVAELDVDIILDDVPDTVSIQTEQFGMLAQILPSMPPQVQGVGFELLIQASTLRNKQKILDKLTGKGEKPQVDPMAEQMKELTLQNAMLDLAKKQEELAKMQTESMLNIAKAEAAEKGQQLAEYTQILTEIKGMLAMQAQGQQSMAPEPQGMAVETS